jgi:quercetin dioxygenase-like cupin family protein
MPRRLNLILVDESKLPADRPVALFPTAQTVGPRDWGEELLLVLAPLKYTLKLLKIKKGKAGGLQYHRLKDEASYIISGKLLVKYENNNHELCERVFSEGEWFHFPVGCIHQEIALTDVERIEVSTPHFNDRVRCEEHFGVLSSCSLPTTKLSEIETR